MTYKLILIFIGLIVIISLLIDTNKYYTYSCITAVISLYVKLNIYEIIT